MNINRRTFIAAGTAAAAMPQLPKAATKDMPICTNEEWLACETEHLPERAGPCYLGLDIGDRDSVVVPYWPQTGRLECYGTFSDLDLIHDEWIAGVYADRHRIDIVRSMIKDRRLWEVTTIHGNGWHDSNECVIGFRNAMAGGRVKAKRPNSMMRTAIAKSKLQFSNDGKWCRLRGIGSRRFADALSAAAMSVSKGTAGVPA